MNEILWSRKAVKQLMRLHHEHQVQVRDAIALLADMPASGSVKALSGHTMPIACGSGSTGSCSTGIELSTSSVFKRSRNVMNAPTDIQIIHGPDGSPAFVVIPYAQYMAQHQEADLIPMTSSAAWSTAPRRSAPGASTCT